MGLQVAAFTSGRKRVSRFDCLLLQHVLWQRPAEGPRIGDYILQQLGAEDDLQQAEYLFQGSPHMLCVLCRCRQQRCARSQPQGCLPGLACRSAGPLPSCLLASCCELSVQADCMSGPTLHVWLSPHAQGRTATPLWQHRPKTHARP